MQRWQAIVGFVVAWGLSCPSAFALLAEQRTGPVISSDGAVNPARSDKTGAQVVTDGHGRYQEAVLRGNVYYAAASAANASAYTGAAAGTPLVGVMNPAGSGKNLVFLGAIIGSRVTDTGAVGCDFEIYGGPSVIPTGTVTVPTNLLSLVGVGSVARAYVNTAMTGSTAITFIMAPLTYGTLPGTAAMNIVNGWVDLAGMVVATPGNMVAIGAPNATTAATFNVTLVWEEVSQ